MTPIIYIQKNSQKYLLCRNYPELPPHFLSTNTNKLRCKYSFANLLLFESRSHLSPVTLVRVPWLEVPNGLNFWTGFKILKSENWGWEQTSVSQTLQNIHFSPSRYQIDCNNTMFISYRGMDWSSNTYFILPFWGCNEFLPLFCISICSVLKSLSWVLSQWHFD